MINKLIGNESKANIKYWKYKQGLIHVIPYLSLSGISAYQLRHNFGELGGYLEFYLDSIPAMHKIKQHQALNTLRYSGDLKAFESELFTSEYLKYRYQFYPYSEQRIKIRRTFASGDSRPLWFIDLEMRKHGTLKERDYRANKIVLNLLDHLMNNLILPASESDWYDYLTQIDLKSILLNESNWEIGSPGESVLKDAHMVAVPENDKILRELETKEVLFKRIKDNKGEILTRIRPRKHLRKKRGKASWAQILKLIASIPIRHLKH